MAINRGFVMKTFFALVLLVSLQALAETNELTPTVKVNASVEFADDMDMNNLDLAIKRQIVAYDAEGLRGTIKFGAKIYPKSILRESLLKLKEIADESKECFKIETRQKCMSDLSATLNNAFTIYRPVAAKGERGFRKGTHFTSYYSPDLSGSLVRTERFKRPIYRMPDNAVDRNATRVQIDYKGAFEGKGYELFWVEDSFYDLYLFHVQGGGRIKVHHEDGTHSFRYLSYAYFFLKI
jgi:membrane-bound lytic murein transglycosylase A